MVSNWIEIERRKREVGDWKRDKRLFWKMYEVLSTKIHLRNSVFNKMIYLV